MQTATAHVLTALYSLCHGIALTDREVEAIMTSGHDLTPDTWQRTGRPFRQHGTRISTPVLPPMSFAGFARARSVVHRAIRNCNSRNARS